MLGAIGLAVVLFVSTNVDDIFVLLAFFADPRYRAAPVAIGQYVGLAALFGISLAASAVSHAFPPPSVGLLGLLPILIGLKKLGAPFGADPGTDEIARRPSRGGTLLTVAAVTIANGGDNIGVYTPVFATHSSWQIGAVAAVFAAMTAIWLLAAHALVNNPWFGAPLRRSGHRVVPIVLIALGVLVMYEAGSFRFLTGLLVSKV